MKHWRTGNEGDSITSPDGQEEGTVRLGRARAAEKGSLAGPVPWRIQHHCTGGCSRRGAVPMETTPSFLWPPPFLAMLPIGQTQMESWELVSGGNAAHQGQPPRAWRMKLGKWTKPAKSPRWRIKTFGSICTTTDSGHPLTWLDFQERDRTKQSPWSLSFYILHL